jgi:serine/threonine protein kinase
VQCATPGVPQGACIFGGVVPGSGSSPVPGAVYSRSPTTSTSTGGSSVCAVGTSFAMKVMKLKREGRSTEKLRQRSYQEVECLRKCQHPLVVGYIDHRENEQDMEFELVMELVEGGDLNLQIAVRAAASHYYLEAEALFYFVQACVSLRSLHRRNILHRDIKAGNFLCLRNGLLKLADFGFARDFSPQNVVGQRVCSEFMGTPSFMAPEVWKREGYGDRAEVWSLGIMLYQLLTLELPFQGSTLESLSRRVCRGTYKEIPETLRVSSHTRALLSSMLAVEPEKRPSLEEILQTPLMRRALRQFKHLCAQNNFLPPEQIAECD